MVLSRKDEATSKNEPALVSPTDYKWLARKQVGFGITLKASIFRGGVREFMDKCWS